MNITKTFKYINNIINKEEIENSFLQFVWKLKVIISSKNFITM